jgi:hypothetical protein
VAEAFKFLKGQQDSYDLGQKKKQKYNAIYLKGDHLSNEDSIPEVTVPVQMSSSLQQKWSKFILPLVTKFISLTIGIPLKVGKVSLLHHTCFCYSCLT